MQCTPFGYEKNLFSIETWVLGHRFLRKKAREEVMEVKELAHKPRQDSWMQLHSSSHWNPQTGVGFWDYPAQVSEICPKPLCVSHFPAY